jgi:hypothetical protein
MKGVAGYMLRLYSLAERFGLQAGFVILLLGCVAFIAFTMHGSSAWGVGIIVISGNLAVLLCGGTLYARIVGRALKRDHLQEQSNYIVASQYALQQLDRRFPNLAYSMSGASMIPANLLALVNLLDELKPRKIVELGCGASSLIISAWLREAGTHRLLSFDHDSSWAQKCRDDLGRSGLLGNAEIYVAPLIRIHCMGQELHWYDLSKYADVLNDVDILVVDGPPAIVEPLARLPAIQFFAGRLTSRAAIFLDDGHRTGECEVVRRWCHSNPEFSAQLHYTQTGCWVLKRQPVVSMTATTNLATTP